MVGISQGNIYWRIHSRLSHELFGLSDIHLIREELVCVAREHRRQVTVYWISPAIKDVINDFVIWCGIRHRLTNQLVVHWRDVHVRDHGSDVVTLEPVNHNVIVTSQFGQLCP